MKISTEIGSSAMRIGERKSIEYVAKAGFDAWDFTMFAMCGYDWVNRRVVDTDHPLTGPNYLTFARELKRIGLDNGIVCNQSHAPIPTDEPRVRGVLKRAIECTAEAGGEICIIHPQNDGSVEENREMYLELLPFAKEHGVKIATENMFDWIYEKNQACYAACGTPESINAHLDAVNDPYFVACLDLGHAEMRGCETSAVEMVEALGSRLQALHIHDNDKWHDSHQIPFSMNLDFEAIVKALQKIGYRGYFTLEADQYLGMYTDEDIPVGLRKLAEVARRLADLFENS